MPWRGPREDRQNVDVRPYERGEQRCSPQRNCIHRTMRYSSEYIPLMAPQLDSSTPTAWTIARYTSLRSTTWPWASQ